MFRLTSCHREKSFVWTSLSRSNLFSDKIKIAGNLSIYLCYFYNANEKVLEQLNLSAFVKEVLLLMLMLLLLLLLLHSFGLWLFIPFCVINVLRRSVGCDVLEANVRERKHSQLKVWMKYAKQWNPINENFPLFISIDRRKSLIWFETKESVGQ